MEDINWKNKDKERLLKALLSLKNTNEAELFLRDLLTGKEINEFANRLEAASQLSKDVQYNSIIRDTGLSSATIARIAKWLRGTGGGYSLVLSRLEENKSHHNSFKLEKGLSLRS